jgi:hypothetical protein
MGWWEDIVLMFKGKDVAVLGPPRITTNVRGSRTRGGPRVALLCAEVLPQQSSVALVQLPGREKCLLVRGSRCGPRVAQLPVDRVHGFGRRGRQPLLSEDEGTRSRITACGSALSEAARRRVDELLR